MREIRYKAKRYDNKQWVEGSLIVLDADSGYYFITEEYLSASTLPVRDLIYDHTHLVDPNTICQYTGRDDKNGNKIWENDIVSAVWYSYVEPIEDITGRVVFDQGWCAYVICDESMGTKSELNGCGAYTYEFEVLGNVYDNSELIDDEY